MPTDFRWNEWNIDHATRHGCAIEEIESVVIRMFPGRKTGDEKYMIEGRGQGNRMIRVVYLLDDDGVVFVIHAMPLTTRRRRSSR